jgi:hypothetical protein
MVPDGELIPSNMLLEFLETTLMEQKCRLGTKKHFLCGTSRWAFGRQQKSTVLRQCQQIGLEEKEKGMVFLRIVFGSVSLRGWPT